MKLDEMLNEAFKRMPEPPCWFCAAWLVFKGKCYRCMREQPGEE